MRRIYDAEPTAVRFHGSDAFVRGVMGPVGCGKSVMCLQEIVHRAGRQAPAATKERKSRWAVIRNTYPELVSTTIKTWQDWLPDAVCPIVFSSPITGRLRLPLQDGTTVVAEILFLALDLPKDSKKLLSLELPGAWVNEARELDKSIIDTITSRVGRYPAKMDGGPSWSGVIMDTNPPDDTHWWYKWAEESPPEGWHFFRQPSAVLEEQGKYRLNPEAENVAHQPLGSMYWLRQVAGKDREWIKVYLMGEYGSVLDGKAIYEGAWSDSLHVSAEVRYIEGGDLYVLWDWGLTPAALFLQVTPRGRLQVLEEVIGDNIGVRQFVDGFIFPLLKGKYKNSRATHIGDPAGRQRAQTDERSVFEELLSFGIRVIPAPTNIPLRRWEAVRYFLGQLRDAKPALVISPACKMLRKGFNGGYRFRRLQTAGDARYSEVADKNMYSHVHDALGYGCEYLRDLDSGKKARRDEVATEPAAAGWT